MLHKVLWAFLIVAVIVVVTVGMYYAVRSLLSETADVSQTPVYTMDDGDNVTPSDVSTGDGGVQGDTLISGVTVTGSNNKFANVTWTSTNSFGRTLTIESANAGVIYSNVLVDGTTSHHYFGRLSELVYDSLIFKTDGVTTAASEALTPTILNVAAGNLYVDDTGTTGTVGLGNLEVVTNFTGDTVVMRGRSSANPGSAYRRNSSGEWAATHDVNSGVASFNMSIAVSGDGSSVFSSLLMPIMSESIQVIDWNDATETWDAWESAVLNNATFALCADWEGLVVADIMSNTFVGAFPDDGNGNADKPDGVTIRRRSAKGEAWGSSVKLLITETSPHPMIRMSHDGNLIAVNSGINSSGQLIHRSGTGLTAYTKTTPAVTSSSWFQISRSTKAMWGATISSGNIVTEIHDIDDFDALTPSWSGNVTRCNITSIASYGMTLTSSTLLPRNVDMSDNMTLLVIGDGDDDSGAVGLFGNTEATSVTNSGHAWIFRRDTADIEWTLESNIDNTLALQSGYFGYSVSAAGSNECPTVAIAHAGNSDVRAGAVLY